MKLNARIKRIVESLKPYEPEKIYLFGSWARGEGDNLSDLDLVLIKKTRASFFKRLRELSKYLPEDAGGIDILVYTPAEFTRMRKEGNAFIEMILQEGVLIYGR